MTFSEAAAHVLRLAGKPLHYKEITDIAIDRGLLSHVGKSPEVTMGARLAAQVKKKDSSNPLSRVKPGVFALSDWDEKKIEAGLADRTPALESYKKGEAAEPRSRGKSEDGEAGASDSPIHRPLASHKELDAGDVPPDEDEQRRAELSAGAVQLFESEDDDDQPIFGAPVRAREVAAVEGEDESADGKRRRRRRRGRNRRDEEPTEDGEEDLPTYTVSDADPDDVAPEILGEAREGRQPREAREPREPRESRRARGGRDRDGRDRGDRDGREREQTDRDGRDRERGERDVRDRDGRDRGERDARDRDRDREGRERDSGGRDREGTGREDVGGYLDGEEDAVTLGGMLESTLSKYERSKGPVSCQNLADALRRKAQGDAQINAASVLSIALTDNLAAERAGRPPRFRVAGNKVALCSWSMDRRGHERQRALSKAAEQYMESSVRALSDELRRLPQRAVGDLLTVLLDRMGVSGMTSIRRPGAHGSELHISGVLRAGGLDIRTGGALSIPTAIVIRRDGKDVGREQVTELRGALHHYDSAAQGYSAAQGWLISTGQVLSGAREEAAAAGATPVCLTGRNELAELCMAYGVGVRMHRIEVPVVDLELFENLQGR